MKNLKVALAHDWLTNMGGAERVLLALCDMFPDAPIYTSVFDGEKMTPFQGKRVITTYLQKWPKSKKHQLYPHMRPRAIEQLDLREYDLVISTTSAEMKGLILKPETLHICYMHTPTRYYWDQYHDYFERMEFGALNPFIKMAMPKMIFKLRQWDWLAAQRPDFVIANSRNSQKRITKYYQRDSEVVHPPVDTARFANAAVKAQKDDCFIYFSRLNPYKRADLAVQACKALDLPLKVVGEGPELEKLKKMAGPKTQFLGWVDDEQIPKLVAQARAFIFPAFEDFGIVPLEAAAAGTPTLAFGKGGSLETVSAGVSGEFFPEQTVESLIEVLQKFDDSRYSQTEMQKWAQNFSREVFEQNMARVIERRWREHEKNMLK